jgi:hypothetical protein
METSKTQKNIQKQMFPLTYNIDYTYNRITYAPRLF